MLNKIMDVFYVTAILFIAGFVFYALYLMADFFFKDDWADRCTRQEQAGWPQADIKEACIRIFPNVAKAKGLTK